MKQTLEDIRTKIDTIDNTVHDLLMERASLVSSVANAKKKTSMQIVQPAREAMMIRRLLARHKGLLPQKTIIRIWRELVGSVALLQSGFSVTVYTDDDKYDFWDMSRDYFGSSVPMKYANGYKNALSKLNEKNETFVVMPWPQIDEESPWWSRLFTSQNDEKISIIGALPYGQIQEDEGNIHKHALVISRVKFMNSENDNSFIALRLEADISRAKIIETTKDIGFNVLNLYSAVKNDMESCKMYLLEVNGFYAVGDQHIEKLSEAFKEGCLYCDPVGGYPVIPSVVQS